MAYRSSRQILSPFSSSLQYPFFPSLGIYDLFIGLTENSKKKENEEAEIHYVEMTLGDTAAAIEENVDNL